MSASSEEALYFVVGDEYSGDRLDKVLAQLMPSVSRARLQTWIEQGAVTVNGEVTEKIRTKVAAGDEIEVLEHKLAELDAKAADPSIYSGDGTEVKELLAAREQVSSELEAKYARWEDLEERAHA